MVATNIQSQLLALSAAEKTQIIQLLLQSISGSWTGIEKTPGVCGGDARIVRTRIPVWVLVEARQLGNNDTELLQNYPTINAQDLANAWAYAASHAEEINQAIKENDEA